MTESTGPADPGSPEPPTSAPQDAAYTPPPLPPAFEPAPAAEPQPPAFEQPAPQPPAFEQPAPQPPVFEQPTPQQPDFAAAPGDQAGYGSPVPPGYPGLVAPPARPPLDVMAIVSLVFTLTLLGSPVGLVLGIISITRTGKGRRAGRGIAVASVVLATLMLLSVVAIIVVIFIFATRDAPRDADGNVTADRSISIDKIRVKDCFNQSFNDTQSHIGLIDVTPCSKPHNSQVAASFTLPDGDFPGAEQISTKASEQCPALMKPELFNDAAGKRDDISIAFLGPDANDWKSNKQVMCVAVTPEKVTGSLVK